LVVLILMRIIPALLPIKNWTKKLVPYAIGSLAAFWLIERVAGF